MLLKKFKASFKIKHGIQKCIKLLIFLELPLTISQQIKIFKEILGFGNLTQKKNSPLKKFGNLSRGMTLKLVGTKLFGVNQIVPKWLTVPTLPFSTGFQQKKDVPNGLKMQIIDVCYVVMVLKMHTISSLIVSTQGKQSNTKKKTIWTCLKQEWKISYLGGNTLLIFPKEDKADISQRRHSYCQIYAPTNIKTTSFLGHDNHSQSYLTGGGHSRADNNFNYCKGSEHNIISNNSHSYYIMNNNASFLPVTARRSYRTSSSVPKEIKLLSKKDYININVSDNKSEIFFYKSLLNDKVCHISCQSKGESSKISEDSTQIGFNPPNRCYSTDDVENNNDIWKGKASHFFIRHFSDDKSLDLENSSKLRKRKGFNFIKSPNLSEKLQSWLAKEDINAHERVWKPP